MEGKIKGTSLSVLSKHLCGIMVTLLFFGERLQFLGIPFYAYAMIAFAIVRLWDNHFIIRRNCLRKFSFSNISSFGLFWILVASVMLPFSVRTAGTRPYVYAVITGLSIIIITSSISGLEDIELLMKYAMIGVITTILVTGFELYTGRHLYQFNEYYTRLGRNSAFGFQVNPNDHATVLVSCVFIVLFFIKKHKIISTTLIVLLVGATLRVGARLAIYTLLVIGVEALILVLITRLSGKRSGVTKFLNVFIFVFLGVTFILSFSVEGFLGIVSSSQNYLMDFNRIILMRRALGTISPLSLLLGHGSGVTMITLGNASIHSVLVEILCDNGVIVVLWLLYFVIKMFFSYTNDIPRVFRIYLPCFATAFVFLCFESSSMLRIHPVWMLLAVMWKLIQILMIGDYGDQSSIANT